MKNEKINTPKSLEGGKHPRISLLQYANMRKKYHKNLSLNN